MVDKSRPRLTVIEGDRKLETKTATTMSMDCLLNFALDIARIENLGDQKSKKTSVDDGFLKVKTTDIVALVMPVTPSEQKQAEKKSAQPK